MSNKTIFKVGDKVFDINYGWGEVLSIEQRDVWYPVKVKFNEESRNYTTKGSMITSLAPTLSFTEYTLQGFSQERPIDYKECIGEWGKFWNDNENTFIIGILTDYYDEDEGEDDEDEYKFAPKITGEYFKNFKLLTEEQLEVLGIKKN